MTAGPGKGVARRSIAGLLLAAGIAAAAPLAALADDGYTLIAAGPASAEPIQMNGGGYAVVAFAAALGVEEPSGAGYSLTGGVVAVADTPSAGPGTPAGGVSRTYLPTVLRHVSP